MKGVLVTGADGHLGRAVARRLLALGEQRLWLWVRAQESAALERKQHALAELLRDPRCRLVCGDLARDEPFSRVPAHDVGAIVHAAAATAFTVSQEAARRVNVDGTRKVLAFARRCRNLDAFLLMSSLYSAGLRAGELAEAPFEGCWRFANFYEWSKWQAERLLLDEYPYLPWRVVRIGTILARDGEGVVVQRNAVHNTLRLFLHGLLPVIPGDPSVRMYLTTTDFAANACARLLRERNAQGFFHAAQEWDEAPDLATLLEAVHDAFMTEETFRRLRPRKPLFCGPGEFHALLDGARQFGSVMGQALSSLAPFAPQLYSDKRVENARLRASLPDLAIPHARALIPRVCSHLAAERWGATGPQESSA